MDDQEKKEGVNVHLEVVEVSPDLARSEEGFESAETLEGLKDDVIDKIDDEVKDSEPEEAGADTLVVHWR